MLELSPAKIPFIGLGAQMDPENFIIPNLKLVIWICSQPTIDVNSQYKFYGVITLEHTIIFP